MEFFKLFVGGSLIMGHFQNVQKLMFSMMGCNAKWVTLGA
jgi:hypothetical protein